jgi:putative transposase
LAPSSKRAARERAHLVLIDESGLLLAPLVRRTLAPAGQTPILKQKAAHRDKVSLSAALCLSPRRRKLSLRFRTYPKQHVNNVRSAEFLRGVLRQLRGRVIVLWDRGNMHLGPPIRELLRRFPRLELQSFPPYAPELNPVEQLWNHLKCHRLVNFAPRDVRHLDQVVRRKLHDVKRVHSRLRSFFDAATLPLADEKRLFSG